MTETMEIINLKLIFSLLFFEHRYLSCYLICQLKSSVYILKVPLKGSVSQIFNLGLVLIL